MKSKTGCAFNNILNYFYPADKQVVGIQKKDPQGFYGKRKIADRESAGSQNGGKRQSVTNKNDAGPESLRDKSDLQQKSGLDRNVTSITEKKHAGKRKITNRQSARKQDGGARDSPVKRNSLGQETSLEKSVADSKSDDKNNAGDRDVPSIKENNARNTASKGIAAGQSSGKQNHGVQESARKNNGVTRETIVVKGFKEQESAPKKDDVVQDVTIIEKKRVCLAPSRKQKLTQPVVRPFMISASHREIFFKHYGQLYPEPREPEPGNITLGDFAKYCELVPKDKLPEKKKHLHKIKDLKCRSISKPPKAPRSPTATKAEVLEVTFTSKYGRKLTRRYEPGRIPEDELNSTVYPNYEEDCCLTEDKKLHTTLFRKKVIKKD